MAKKFVHDPEMLVEIWCKEVSGVEENLFVRTLKGKRMNYPQIAEVVKAIRTVCPTCWNAWTGEYGEGEVEGTCKCKN